MVSHMAEISIYKKDVVADRKVLDVLHEWTYKEVLQIIFDGAYTLMDDVDSVFVGTIDTGFYILKMTNVDWTTTVGSIYSFNSAYRMIIFEFSYRTPSCQSTQNNSFEVSLRSSTTYDQLPRRKDVSTGPILLHN